LLLSISQQINPDGRIRRDGGTAATLARDAKSSADSALR
jgi:hypothetical protein